MPLAQINTDFEIMKALFFFPGQLLLVSTHSSTKQVKKLNSDFFIQSHSNNCATDLEYAPARCFYTLLQTMNLLCCLIKSPDTTCLQMQNHLIFRLRITTYLSHCFFQNSMVFTIILKHVNSSFGVKLRCFAWMLLDLRMSGGSLHTKPCLFVNRMLCWSSWRSPSSLWIRPLCTNKPFAPMFGPHFCFLYFICVVEAFICSELRKWDCCIKHAFFSKLSTEHCVNFTDKTSPKIATAWNQTGL